MKKIFTLAALVLLTIPRTLAQTSIPDPYCMPIGESGGGNMITFVQLGTLSNLTTDTTTPTPYYTFYNNLAVPDITCGEIYQLTAVFNVAGPGANASAWIDFNHNNIFDDSEIIPYYVFIDDFMDVGVDSMKKHITIPTTATPGYTRLRVRIQRNDSSSTDIYPCYSDTTEGPSWTGETQDYAININAANAGIRNIGLENELIHIYPNPATDMLMVADAPNGSTLKIYSITGEAQYEGVVLSKPQIINLANLSAGLYLIEIINKNGNRSVQHFSVKH